MQIRRWEELDEAGRTEVLARPRLAALSDVTALAASIIREVRQDGDAALLRFAARYDKVRLESLRASREEIDTAAGRLTAQQREAIE
jgi:histidinol dehydrogenase